MPADKPILIWDGTCGFCRIWVDYWRRSTGDRIEYLTSQEVGGRFPQIPPEAYREAVQLVRPDGTVVSGALAVFESLGMQTLYVGFGGISELAYRDALTKLPNRLIPPSNPAERRRTAVTIVVGPISYPWIQIWR